VRALRAAPHVKVGEPDCVVDAEPDVVCARAPAARASARRAVRIPSGEAREGKISGVWTKQT